MASAMVVVKICGDEDAHEQMIMLRSVKNDKVTR
jgi:hypothetical protein